MLKTVLAASLFAFAVGGLAAPVAAQPKAAESTVTSGALSVDKTPISDIIKNEKAKSALEATVPQIEQFYAQIGPKTPAELVPMSHGAMDEAMLKELQAKFDQINAGK